MLHSIALTFIPGITPSMQLEFLRHYSSAEDVIMRPEETLTDLNTEFRMRTIRAINIARDGALKAAREELAFCQQHGIKVMTISSPDYPTRLADCTDAPPILYYRGTADLNARHIIAIVGTRKVTEYGKLLCERFTTRLAELLPDALVVSGLAYGVDIHAHRGAMDHGLPTVGVVAHGMDQIYPATHRNDARRMVSHGGILTEYTRGTRPLQGNFLRRNRIVAGMADATIVVESAEHGGSLVTARIANSYNRQVFAFPGRITDAASVGCNNLILHNKAAICLTADDVVQELGWWEDTTVFLATHQPDLFGNLSEGEVPFRPSAAAAHNKLLASLAPEQHAIVEALEGSDGLTASALSSKVNMPSAETSTLLFDLEMSDIVKVLPGGLYLLKK